MGNVVEYSPPNAHHGGTERAADAALPTFLTLSGSLNNDEDTSQIFLSGSACCTSPASHKLRPQELHRLNLSSYALREPHSFSPSEDFLGIELDFWLAGSFTCATSGKTAVPACRCTAYQSTFCMIQGSNQLPYTMLQMLITYHTKIIL